MTRWDALPKVWQLLQELLQVSCRNRAEVVEACKALLAHWPSEAVRAFAGDGRVIRLASIGVLMVITQAEDGEP